MDVTLHKGCYSYIIDPFPCYATIPKDPEWLSRKGFEWFDFEGVRNGKPYKTRAMFTKSETARDYMEMNSTWTTLEPWERKLRDKDIAKEKNAFFVNVNYTRKYQKYVPPVPQGEEYCKHQIETARWMLNRKRLLLADKPGLGKTISAFCTVNAVHDIEQRKPKVLIVSPAKVQKTWREEAHKWAVNYETNEIQVFKSSEYVSPETNILIVNYESLDGNIADFINYKADIIISDESHLVKNSEALRTQNLAWLIKSASYVMLMTGTPILNCHKELYTLVELLMPGKLPHYHCFPFYEKELKMFLYKHIMLLRDKDVLKNKIPEHNNFFDYVDVKLDKEYASFKKPMSVMRHEVGRAKIPAAVAKAKQFLKTHNKIVIFCYHTDVADKVEELLSADYEVVVSHGKKTKKQCSEAEDRFRTGTARVFVAAIKSCGAGLTLIEASRMIIMELDWTPANLEQSEKRISRIGQTVETEAHYLIAKGIDVEERMLKTIAFKNKITSII